MGFPENQYPQQQVPGGQPVMQTLVVKQEPSNGIGMAGFICSLVGLFTCGVLFPIGLILSFVGLFFEPRGFAIAGVCISLGSILLAVVCWFLFIGALVVGTSAAASTIEKISEEVNVRVAIQEKVKPKLNKYYIENERMPDDIEFKKLLGAQARQYRLKPISETEGSIIQWGKDEQFDTFDDREFEYEWNDLTRKLIIHE